jgi:putative oxidoreductase
MKKDIALLLLRQLGLLMALGHGWGKIAALAAGQGGGFIHGVSELGFPAPAVFAWAAALAEFVGGLCVALGVGTRYAAGFVGFTMFVAAFVRHNAHKHLLVKLGLFNPGDDVLTAWGNPELAFIYCLGFVAIALLGGGRLALDPLLGRRR